VTPHGEVLVRFARAHLEQRLGGAAAPWPEGAWCEVPGATFVTLRWASGDLHGCVGTLVPRRPVVEDVAANAVGAALHDPRSGPIALADVRELDVEVSILSALSHVAFADEKSALAALRVGEDGVVLSWRGIRTTFLPAMWPRLGDARAFMRALKEKAGLDADFWAPDVELMRYTVEKAVDRAPAARELA
jgi:AmmeMemoRadiSam system protein A